MKPSSSTLSRYAVIALALLAPLSAETKAQKSLHTYLQNHSAGMPLSKDMRGIQHIAKGRVNGKEATFLLDTGSPSSTLDVSSVEKFDLKMNKLDRKAKGIGGNEDIYMVKLKDFKIGPHIKIGDQPVQAVKLNRATDGLIGRDLLKAINGIIDFSTDRLCYPSNGKPIDLTEPAKKFKATKIDLKVSPKGHQIIECDINGQPARMILDTGAQQSVLDTKFAAKCGVNAYDTPVVVAGVGGKSKPTQIGSIAKLSVGKFSLERFPALVMNLGHLSNSGKDFDGILGAELLHASGCIYDIGGRALYFDSGTMETGDISILPGEFPMADADLRKKVADTELVAECKVAGLGRTSKKATVNGKEYTLAMITLEIQRLIKADDKGANMPGTKIQCLVLVPQRPDLAEFLKYFASRNPQKVLFYNPSLKDRAVEEYPILDDAIFTAGTLRTAHLKRVMAKGSK